MVAGAAGASGGGERDCVAALLALLEAGAGPPGGSGLPGGTKVLRHGAAVDALDPLGRSAALLCVLLSE